MKIILASQSGVRKKILDKYKIDNEVVVSKVDEDEIKSKWGVCPLITHPRAMNASYFLRFFDIVTGISKTPGTFIILILYLFKIFFLALSTKPWEIFL